MVGVGWNPNSLVQFFVLVGAKMGARGELLARLQTFEAAGSETLTDKQLTDLLVQGDATLTSSQISHLVKGIDPSNKGYVTFAEILDYFSAESSAEVAFLVEGAGSNEVNGSYMRQDVVLCDAPTYANGHGTVMCRTGDSWVFSRGTPDLTEMESVWPTCFYIALHYPESPTAPPTGGWRLCAEGPGQEPGPRVVGRAAQPAGQANDWSNPEFVLGRMAPGSGFVNAWMNFGLADVSLRGDFDFALKAMAVNPANVSSLSDELKKNKDIGVAAVRGWSYGLASLDPALRADRDVVITALTSNHNVGLLRFAGPALQADREVVFAAAMADVDNLQSAAPALLADAALFRDLLHASFYKGPLFKYVDPALLSQRDFMLEAVTLDGELFQHAGTALKRDRELALAAIESSRGRALAYADESLKADPEVVRAAVLLGDTNPPSILSFAAEGLQVDRDMVLLASGHGFFSLGSLPEAGKELLSDRELILAAVSRKGTELQFAAPALRGDREVFEAAFGNSFWAFKHASEELQADEGFSKRYAQELAEYEDAWDRAMR